MTPLPTPPDAPDECLRARQAIARFVGSAADRGRQPPTPEAFDEARFRAHLLQCGDCRHAYREQLSAAARMGRELRTERGECLRRLRHERFQQRALEATSGGKRSNRFGLRLALIPGLFALLLILFRETGGSEGLVVRWEGGEVHAAGQLLNADRPLLRLSPGDWCRTRGNARVTLAGSAQADPEFLLAPETDVLVLDPRARGLRLERGELEAHGPARLFTPYGVLELDEEARVELRVGADGGRLRVLAGSVLRTGPSGEARLRAGESAPLFSG